MNDDLILRARLHQAGYSEEEILKRTGGVFGDDRFTLGGAGAASQKFTDRLFGGKRRLANRLGQNPQTFADNQNAAIRGQKQMDQTAAYQEQMGQKGFETVVETPKGMTEPSIKTTAAVPGEKKRVSLQNAMGKYGLTSDGGVSEAAAQQQPQPDGSNTGTSAVPDKTTTTVENGPDGQPNQVNTETVMNANAEAPATGGGDINTETGGGAPDPNAGAAQQPAQQPAQQQQPATGGGGGGVNPNVRNMAQQFQAGQDMQAIQQGKGADKQSWLKNRSGMGKLMDIATFGATSRLGSTGGAARSKANQQSQQQTKNYQAANQRMNQRAMGMNPTMVATSLDSQLSAYSDIIAIRKGIQERNTTYNLRR